MEWYYAKDGSSHGPVTGFDIRELLRVGAINRSSLVWAEGMAEWRPLADCLDRLSAAPVSDASSHDGPSSGPPGEALAVCAWSGETRPESQMLRYGDQWVAPEYKDLFVQRLQEGGATETDSGIDPSDLPADLSFTSVLTQSFQIWRVNLAAIVLVTVAIWLPLNLALEYYSYQNVEVDESFENTMSDVGREFRLQNQLDFWIGIIVVGATVAAACRSWAGRSPMSLGEAFGAGFRHWGRLWVTRLVFGLLLVLLLIPGIGLLVTGNSIMAALGVVYMVIAATIYYVRHGFADISAVADSKGGIRALEVSRQVTRRHFWRIVGYQILVFGMITGVSIVPFALLLIPALDHFVVSGLISTFANVALSFGMVERLVLFRHLEANPR